MASVKQKPSWLFPNTHFHPALSSSAHKTQEQLRHPHTVHGCPNKFPLPPQWETCGGLPTTLQTATVPYLRSEGPRWEWERKADLGSSRLRQQSQEQGPWCLQTVLCHQKLLLLSSCRSPSQAQHLRSRMWRQIPSKGGVCWMGWVLSHHPTQLIPCFLP